MKKASIRVWYEDIQFEGRQKRIYYTMPDMFFDYALFICLKCASLLGVDRQGERYLKRDFSSEKEKMTCPECSSSLVNATQYPETFIWDDLDVGSFDTSKARPSKDRMETIEIWDVLHG